MSCGRAVITTDWSGCREAVIDGKNGYLVEAKNTEMLADRMKKLVEDRALLEKMAEESYELCKRTYEIGIINLRMSEIMEY